MAHMNHRSVSKFPFKKRALFAKGPLPVNFPLDPVAEMISGKDPNLKGGNLCVDSQVGTSRYW